MATYPGWEQQILQQLGVTNPDAVKKDIRFLDAWQQSEGGTAAFNPLNTTQNYPGATNYNSVGVKNYPSNVAGTSATTTTLINGRYPLLVQQLRTGNPDALFSNANIGEYTKEVNTWGTNPLTVEARYNQLAGTNYNTATASSAANAATGGALTVVKDVGSALSFVFSYRFLEILGGGLLLLLGLYLLARQIGVSVPGPARVPLPGTGRDIYQRG